MIAYVIVCAEMKNYLEEMVIGDDRTHVLTKYASTAKIAATSRFLKLAILSELRDFRHFSTHIIYIVV